MASWAASEWSGTTTATSGNSPTRPTRKLRPVGIGPGFPAHGGRLRGECAAPDGTCMNRALRPIHPLRDNRCSPSSPRVAAGGRGRPQSCQPAPGPVPLGSPNTVRSGPADYTERGPERGPERCGDDVIRSQVRRGHRRRQTRCGAPRAVGRDGVEVRAVVARERVRERGVVLQTAWSSTLRVSARGWSRSVRRSRTYSRHGASAGRPLSRLLYAMRVPSGESEGHSTFVRSVVSVRVRRSPRTR